MCGICGIIYFNSKEVEKANIQLMMNKMKHRGPDDEGLFIDHSVGLGHVRLSIIDLSSAGHQPMFSADNRYCIVYNGEIYNYLELKNELKDEYLFRSNTDTEVIIASYIKWGEKCLDKFNGMFAFALYDKAEQKIFIARDRFGIKPFFYYQDKERFIFASDIAPIISVLNISAGPNNQSIYDYLVFNRTNYDKNTFFSNIYKLQHSCCLVIKNSTVTQRRWYKLFEKRFDVFKNIDDFQRKPHTVSILENEKRCSRRRLFKRRHRFIKYRFYYSKPLEYD